jgi:hypothetical protein
MLWVLAGVASIFLISALLFVAGAKVALDDRGSLH